MCTIKQLSSITLLLALDNIFVATNMQNHNLILKE